MKRTLFTTFACVLAFSAGATHFPPTTTAAVKRLAHDETHLYILHYDCLEVLEKATGKTVCYTQASGHIPEGNINSNGPNGKEPALNALAVHDGTVWVGGNDFLTAIVGEDAQSWHFSYDITISIPSYPYIPNMPMPFNCITFDSKNRMYLGGNDQVGYLKEPGKAVFVGLPDNMSNGAEVWQMLVGKDDVVWVSYTSDSGHNSLIKYTAGGEVEEMSSKLGLGNHIKALALDKDKNLWFGTNNSPKLFCYDGETLEEYEIVKIAGGWMYSGICCMSFDEKGRLWLLQSNSQELGYGHYSTGPLCCFSDGELTEYPLPEDVGLCYCLDVDGDDVYVGTDKGVFQFAQNKLINLDVSPYTETTLKTIEKQPQDIHNEAYDLQGRKLKTDKAVKIHIEKGRIVLGH